MRKALLAGLAILVAGCSGGPVRNIERLLTYLASDSLRARARAEKSLAEHGRTFIKPLSNILTGKDLEQTVEDYNIKSDPATLRVPAAEALGVIAAKASLARSEAETAAEPLLAVLWGDDRAVRIAAAKALGRFTQLSAPANDLILLLREDDEELVKAATASLANNALRAIYRLVPRPEPTPQRAEKDWARLLERLRSTDSDIRLDTVRELAASGNPKAADLLLDRLANDTSRDVRFAAFCFCMEAALRGEPKGFAQKFATQLPVSFKKDDDSRVVLLTARLLKGREPQLVGKFLERVEGAIGECRKRLVELATSSAYEAASRADAINALALLPSTERDELLARLLDREAGERARVRRAAAGVLADSPTPVAVAALEKAMADQDRIVKLIAAQALGRRGKLEAVRYLVDLLSDAEAKIRTPAADAIGTLGPKAVPVLVEELRQALAEATQLAQWEVPLGKLEAKGELTADEEAKAEELRQAIADFREKHPGRSVNYTLWGVVTGLGRIAAAASPRPAAALDALIEALDCHYAEVRRVAAEALGHLDEPKALEALGEVLDDPDPSVRWYAAGSLVRRGKAAVPFLVAALAKPNGAGDAAAALGKLADPAALAPLVASLAKAPAPARENIAWAIGRILRRNPGCPGAQQARNALAAASRLANAPGVARVARQALAALPRQ